MENQGSTDSIGITLWDNCGALQYHALVNHALSPVSKLRNYAHRIGAGGAGKRPARTRAGIKYPFLRPVDRDPECGNVSGNAGICHDQKVDRGGRHLLAGDRDGAGRGSEEQLAPQNPLRR